MHKKYYKNTDYVYYEMGNTSGGYESGYLITTSIRNIYQYIWFWMYISFV